MIKPAKSLLLFSIGPVQSFISASRKTLDLFSGSKLLSEMAGACIDEVRKNQGQIIFPYIQHQNDLDQPLPNRFLALLDKDKAKETAEAAVKAGKEYINNCCAESRRAIEAKDTSFANNPHWAEGWRTQIDTFWEYYWTLLDADPDKMEDPKYYGELYNRIERLSGERKSLRDFSQLYQDGIKCSYFQGYSALFPLGHNGKIKDAKDFAKDYLSRRFIGKYKPGETLSAIAFLKREFGWKNQDGSYPSTINLANGDFNQAIVTGYSSDEKIKKAVDEFIPQYKLFAEKLGLSHVTNYKKLLAEYTGVENVKSYLKSDNQFLIEDELGEKAIELEYGEGLISKDELSELSKRVSSLKKAVGSPVKKYYAVLYFDGDQMGKWLSGAIKNSSDENFKISLQKHSEISQALKVFAEESVPEIVEEKYLGKLIFAGGDDVIAFCTLSSLLDIVRDIRVAFEEAMGQATGNFAPATGSCGITIAHWQQSLQMVLREAREAEKFAKNDLGRNAFAISVMKRSGEKVTCGAKFDPDFTVIKLMKDFYSLLDKEIISSSFVYTFESELMRLTGESGGKQDADMLMSLFTYFFLRKSEAGSGDQKKENTEKINTWLRDAKEYITKSKDSYKALTELTELLKTVQFMRRGND